MFIVFFHLFYEKGNKEKEKGKGTNCSAAETRRGEPSPPASGLQRRRGGEGKGRGDRRGGKKGELRRLFPRAAFRNIS